MAIHFFRSGDTYTTLKMSVSLYSDFIHDVFFSTVPFPMVYLRIVL